MGIGDLNDQDRTVLSAVVEIGEKIGAPTPVVQLEQCLALETPAVQESLNRLVDASMFEYTSKADGLIFSVGSPTQRALRWLASA